MSILAIGKDLEVFGVEVNTFPLGITEVFDSLSKKIPDGLNRAYYGLSKMRADGSILYIAAAEQKHEGEALRYGYTKYTIPRGEYATQAIHNWMSKLGAIKDVFSDLMNQEGIDMQAYCVEWYKSDDEMLCMVKMERAPANSTEVRG